MRVDKAAFPAEDTHEVPVVAVACRLGAQNWLSRSRQTTRLGLGEVPLAAVECQLGFIVGEANGSSGEASWS